MATTYAYYTLRASNRDGIDILGWGTYPRSSVLSGQPMKVFLESKDTEQEARQWLRDYLVREQGKSPAQASKIASETNFSNKWTEPQVSLNHLPSEDDPVPGGMYPDDYEGVF